MVQALLISKWFEINLQHLTSLTTCLYEKQKDWNFKRDEVTQYLYLSYANGLGTSNVLRN